GMIAVADSIAPESPTFRGERRLEREPGAEPATSTSAIGTANTTADAAVHRAGSVLETVFLDLVIDRLERELQQLGGLLLVTARELERLGDESPFDIGQGVSDRDAHDRRLAPADPRPRQRAAEDGPPDGRRARRFRGSRGARGGPARRPRG